jgi:hypothetical protein
MKTNLSDKQVKKIADELKKGRKKRDPAALQQALKEELEGLSGLELLRRESEIREQWTLATEKTTAKMGGFLEGLLGPKIGKAFAQKYARADDKDVEKASAFFDKYKKDQDKKEGIYAKKSEKASKEFNSLKKAVMNIQKNVLVIRKTLGNKSSPAPTTKADYYFDPRMSGGGRWKEAASDKMVSAKEVQLRRSESLGKAIAADEDPMLRVAESMEGIMKSLGEMTKNKTVHEKLDEMQDDMEDLDDSSIFDLLGNSGGRRGRRGRRGRKGRQGSRKTRTGRRGRMGGAIGLGGLLAGAGVGYLAYSAVDSFRDPNLVSDDPEFLKQQAEIASSEEQKQAIGDQIAAQKKDLQLQAGASAAAVGGAAVGVTVTKKVAQSAVVKTVKSKVWDLFVKFVSKRAPTLAAKLGARLVAAGALATVPLLGWVGTAINLGLAAWLVYDLYTLWREFSALSDAEKALAANGNGPSSKAVNDWAYSVFIGKAQLENVPDQYKEEVESILKKPPSSWKKDKQIAAGQMAPAAANIKAPEQSVDDQIGTQVASFAAKASDTVQETAGSAWKTISSGVSSAYESTKKFLGFGGDGSAASESDLEKYVRLNPGVDIKGLNPQMKTRLAGMSKEYYDQTGKKIQLNSGYRSPEEQAKLYAKLGPPKAAPPGRSRHESGLAVDMNSVDANKATELGLMQKYGFTRPVRGESWHVEPIETSKRGGSPDNPYKPGAPVAVANKNGDPVSPNSGKTAQSLGTGMSAGAAQSAPASSGSFTSSEIRTETSNDGSAQVTVTRSSSTTTGAKPNKYDQPVWLDSGPDWLDAKQNKTDLKPQMTTSGEELRSQSVGIEDSKMQLGAAPAPVVNNIQTGQSGIPPMIPRSPSPKATTRPQDSSFMRALAKDFAHPTAFTTVSMT